MEAYPRRYVSLSIYSPKIKKRTDIIALKIICVSLSFWVEFEFQWRKLLVAGIKCCFPITSDFIHSTSKQMTHKIPSRDAKWVRSYLPTPMKRPAATQTSHSLKPVSLKRHRKRIIRSIEIWSISVNLVQSTRKRLRKQFAFEKKRNIYKF